MFASKNELFTRPSGYNIARSVRLRSSASAYFNRTPATTGNQQKFTWSGWVKLGILSANVTLFSTGVAPAARFQISTASNALGVAYNDSASWVLDVTTNAVYRDPSAWYHVVVAVDTTQATATNRVLVYVNGAPSLYTGTNASLNLSTNVNTAVSHSIGRLGNGTAYLDGYLTEINFIDGTALTPSSFGSTNAITGVWQPAKYTGTYGTNGFYLNFSDNSAATAATIGKDYSGNANNWTPNNISVTAGVTYDSMLDVPTPYADGGNGRGNYAVLNGVNKGTDVTLSAGNLQFNCTAASANSAASTIAISSGKWYVEGTVSTGAASSFGVSTIESFDPQARPGGWTGSAVYEYSGSKRVNGSLSSYGTGWALGSVIGMALDLSAGTLDFYRNGVSQGTAVTGLSGTYYVVVGDYGTSTAAEFTVNFGQSPYTYTNYGTDRPASTFVALNTYNLPTPTISNGANYMAVTTYTGNGGTQSVVNTGNVIGTAPYSNNPAGVIFQPDWVWNKSRSAATSNNLTDSVRGVQKSLFSNNTAAELSACELTAFNSNGFTLARDAARAEQNESASTYVSWQWKAGGTSVSNTSGTITSTVSVGATQGFSVVTYAGNGSTGTVGHGLGVAPKMIIVKNRTTATTNWATYHSSISSSPNNIMYFNLTLGSSVDAAFNNTNPTSSVFSVGNRADTNTSANNYVAYCFSEVSGYSAFGSYTGNGSTDGPFVYLGFRPRFIMYKRTDTTGDWLIEDSTRDTANPETSFLIPNKTNAESTGIPLDFTANGFKLRTTNSDTNASAGTYIFMAVAENPFKLSLAR